MKKTISLVLILVLGMVTEIAKADFTFGTSTNLGPTVNSSANKSGQTSWPVACRFTFDPLGPVDMANAIYGWRHDLQQTMPGENR